MMNRLIFLLIASCAVLPPSFAASPRPNILFIYVEDLGY